MFKTQQEIWTHLMNGGKVSMPTWGEDTYISLKKGNTVFTGSGYTENKMLATFENPADWITHKTTVQKIVMVFVNVYQDGKIGNAFDTQEQADEHVGRLTRLACVKLTGTYETKE